MATKLDVFKIAQRESEESEEAAEDVIIPIPDQWGNIREITFRGPNTTETTMLLMLTSGPKNMLQAVASSLDLILGLIEDAADRRWLHSRLMDRDDPMSIMDVTEMVMLLIEEWFARPTQGQPDSSGSQPPSGKKSTGQRHRKASGHSTSRPTGS